MRVEGVTSGGIRVGDAHGRVVEVLGEWGSVGCRGTFRCRPLFLYLKEVGQVGQRLYFNIKGSVSMRFHACARAENIYVRLVGPGLVLGNYSLGPLNSSSTS